MGDDPGKPPRFEVDLVVDGRVCTLKPFMHEMIGGAIMGLVQGLKGVDHPTRIELGVKCRDAASPSAADEC